MIDYSDLLEVLDDDDASVVHVHDDVDAWIVDTGERWRLPAGTYQLVGGQSPGVTGGSDAGPVLVLWVRAVVFGPEYVRAHPGSGCEFVPVHVRRHVPGLELGRCWEHDSEIRAGICTFKAPSGFVGYHRPEIDEIPFGAVVSLELLPTVFGRARLVDRFRLERGVQYIRLEQKLRAGSKVTKWTNGAQYRSIREIREERV